MSDTQATDPTQGFESLWKFIGLLVGCFGAGYAAFRKALSVSDKKADEMKAEGREPRNDVEGWIAVRAEIKNNNTLLEEHDRRTAQNSVDLATIRAEVRGLDSKVNGLQESVAENRKDTRQIMDHLLGNSRR